MCIFNKLALDPIFFLEKLGRKKFFQLKIFFGRYNTPELIDRRSKEGAKKAICFVCREKEKNNRRQTSRRTEDSLPQKAV